METKDLRIKVLIDFDGTLFDSKEYKKVLNQVLVNAGMKEEDVLREYENWKISNNNHANPAAFALSLYDSDRYKKHFKVDRESLSTSINEAVNSASKYLFKDSVSFLKGIDRSKYQPIIFTFGNKEFQRLKIEACGLADLVEDVVYSESPKIGTIAGLVDSGESFIVIDDEMSYLKGVESNFPNARIFPIDRYGKLGQGTESLSEISDGFSRVPVENDLARS